MKSPSASQLPLLVALHGTGGDQNKYFDHETYHRGIYKTEAEKRGVLVKSVEDTALGVAAVYRALELPLPKTMPYASKELRNRFVELVARVMPFDLVIDEHTVDGTEARISKTSMAGSWGAVAGTLRYFGDRNGIARAGIEGTTIPYDLVRKNARKGQPVISVAGARKHRHVALSRRLTYFGFELETVVEELRGEVPPELREQARDAAHEIKKAAQHLLEERDRELAR